MHDHLMRNTDSNTYLTLTGLAGSCGQRCLFLTERLEVRSFPILE